MIKVEERSYIVKTPFPAWQCKHQHLELRVVVSKCLYSQRFVSWASPLGWSNVFQLASSQGIYKLKSLRIHSQYKDHHILSIHINLCYVSSVLYIWKMLIPQLGLHENLVFNFSLTHKNRWLNSDECYIESTVTEFDFKKWKLTRVGYNFVI
jgi:hypothetical protein